MKKFILASALVLSALTASACEVVFNINNVAVPVKGTDIISVDRVGPDMIVTVKVEDMAVDLTVGFETDEEADAEYSNVQDFLFNCVFSK
jgi:hypothetical protein